MDKIAFVCTNCILGRARWTHKLPIMAPTCELLKGDRANIQTINGSDLVFDDAHRNPKVVDNATKIFVGLQNAMSPVWDLTWLPNGQIASVDEGNCHYVRFWERNKHEKQPTPLETVTECLGFRNEKIAKLQKMYADYLEFLKKSYKKHCDEVPPETESMELQTYPALQNFPQLTSLRVEIATWEKNLDAAGKRWRDWNWQSNWKDEIDRLEVLTNDLCEHLHFLTHRHLAGSWQQPRIRQHKPDHEQNEPHALCLAWSNYWNKLASGDSIGRVILWGDLTYDEQRNITNGKLLHVNSMCWIANGMLATGCEDGVVSIWNVNGFNNCMQLANTISDRDEIYRVRSMAASSDGTQFASTGIRSGLRIYDVTTCEVTSVRHQPNTGHNWVIRGLRGLSWDPTSSYLLAAGNGETNVCINDTRAPEVVQTFLGDAKCVRSVAWSPDGQRIASCGTDTAVRVFDIKSGQCEHVLKGHKDEVMTVAWSPDGKQLASGSRDASIRVWTF